MSTVDDVVRIIESFAKPQYAYEWDNCGLQVGCGKNEVTNVLITLDITKQVVSEAKAKHCELIISHHPLIFKPIFTVEQNTYEGEVISELIKNGISLYCAHTSLDIAHGGVNDALCHTLELENIMDSEPISVNGETVSCGRIGYLKNTMNKDDFVGFVKEKTGANTVLYGGLKDEISKVSLCTGAGEDMAFYDKSADVFITGEIKHHTALELRRQNIPFIAIGHYYSEIHIADFLADSLQKQINMLQYNVNVYASTTNTNPFDC